MRKLAILIILVATAAVALPQRTRRKPPARSLTRKRLSRNLRPWQVPGKVRLSDDMSDQLHNSRRIQWTAILHEGIQVGRSTNRDHDDSTWRVIVCSRPIIVTREIVRAWKASYRRMERAIEFSFLDVAGGTQGGFLKDMVFTMIDANHHIVEFTFVMPDGKPIQLRGEFQRTK